MTRKKQKQKQTKTKNVERHAGGYLSILNRTHPFILMTRTHQTFNWDLTF